MTDALTPKREAFAQAIVSGVSQSDAYRSAFTVNPKTKPDSVNQAASKLMADPKVASRVAELRQPVVKQAQITLASHLDRLEHLSKAAEMSLQFGPAITAETSRGKASGLYVEKIQVDIKVDMEQVNSKIAALMAKMTGNKAGRK